jgi:hypothetical protein
VAVEEGRIAFDFGSTLAVLSSAIGLNGFFGGPDGSKKALIMRDNDRSRRIVVYLSGDSKFSGRKHMPVQVPPSAPHFSVRKPPCFSLAH